MYPSSIVIQVIETPRQHQQQKYRRTPQSSIMHYASRRTDCSGKTRLVSHGSSSSRAGKRCYCHYYLFIIIIIVIIIIIIVIIIIIIIPADRSQSCHLKELQLRKKKRSCSAASHQSHCSCCQVQKMCRCWLLQQGYHRQPPALASHCAD